MQWFQGFFCRCMPIVEFPQDEEEQFEGLIQDNAWGSRTIEPAHQIEEEPSSTRIESKPPPSAKNDVDEIKVILSIVEQIRKRSSLSKSELVVELRRMLAAFGGGEVDDGKEKEKDQKGKGKTGGGTEGIKGQNEQEGDSLRQAVLRNVLTHYRDEIVNREKHQVLMAFVAPLISALDDEQQRELYTILRYMPASVLGDEFAREQTRVFIDVAKDVREAQRVEKGNVSHKAKMVEVVSGIIIELIQALGPGEEGNVLTALLSSIDQPQALRLVLEQLLLVSDWMPSDTTKRGNLFNTLFRESITFNVK